MTDPRIHERRVQVAREKGRLRRRAIVVGLAVASLLLAGLALVHSSFFGARHVELEGAAHTSYPRVVAAAGLRGAPPLVDLSAAVIARRVEALPWVEKAAVALEWPSTVRIELTERTPVAVVRGGTGYALVDRTGRVLEDLASRRAGLPYLLSSGALPSPGGRLSGHGPALAAVAADMPESMVNEVTALGWTRQGATVRLRDGIVALIGSPQAVGEKFVSLATVLAKADLSDIGTIDLRVPSDPVLIAASRGPIVSRNVGG